MSYLEFTVLLYLIISYSIATAVIARTEGNKDEFTEQEGIMVNNISPANQLAYNT